MYKKLIILKRVFRKIINDVKLNYPKETCGILAGEISRENILVKFAKPLPNISKDYKKFWFDELLWIKDILTITSKNLKYIGLYHSHPNGSVVPSLSDIERMLECPGEIWLIISYNSSRIYEYSAWTIPRYGAGIFKIPVLIK